MTKVKSRRLRTNSIWVWPRPPSQNSRGGRFCLGGCVGRQAHGRIFKTVLRIRGSLCNQKRRNWLKSISMLWCLVLLFSVPNYPQGPQPLLEAEIVDIYLFICVYNYVCARARVLDIFPVCMPMWLLSILYIICFRCTPGSSSELPHLWGILLHCWRP